MQVDLVSGVPAKLSRWAFVSRGIDRTSGLAAELHRATVLRGYRLIQGYSRIHCVSGFFHANRKFGASDWRGRFLAPEERAEPASLRLLLHNGLVELVGWMPEAVRLPELRDVSLLVLVTLTDLVHLHVELDLIGLV